ETPAAAALVLNGLALPRLDPGRPWCQRVTHLLQERNELLLTAATPGTDAPSVGLPASLGRPLLEIVAVRADG
ncbi:MAG: hypothetical protein EBS56_08800, partial [Planctomycetia bacterium]|nr:hypothetical protein [Planctomycetia bacterium]